MASTFWTVLVAVIATFIGYLLGTSPSGVTPPFLPLDSPVRQVPPWPLFRVGSTLNHWFYRATVATTPPHVAVVQQTFAHWQSHVIYALVKNDIVEALAVNNSGSNNPNGGMTCGEVATQLSLHEHGTCEYIRAGVQMDLIDEVVVDYYKPSETGKLLLKDSPQSFRDLILAVNEEMAEGWKAARTITIREGKTDGFTQVFGQNYYDWHAEHPDLEAQFARAMTNLGQAFVAAFVADYPFPQDTTTKNERFVFCDVGGGVGTSAAMVLEHYPNMSALVMDRDTVAPQADQFMASKGLGDRAKGVPGNFLQPGPAGFPEVMRTCDVFFLKYILHNWSDENGIKILSNIRAVAKPGSKVVIMENVLGTMPQRSSMELSKALMSLNMYSSYPWGARERSLDHFGRLLVQAGYESVESSMQLLNLRELLSAVVVEV